MNRIIRKSGRGMKPKKLNLIESCGCKTPYFVQKSQTLFSNAFHSQMKTLGFSRFVTDA